MAEHLPRILIGDAREPSNLQKLEVDRARCVIVCTDDDISNLEIALSIRMLDPERKVVLQLHDPDLAARVRQGETITLLCSSACVDESRCHRSLLRELIESAVAR